MSICQPVYESLVSSLDSEHKDLLLRFFLLFSRFEYALKRTSRFSKINYNTLQPNWNKFKLDYRETFNIAQLPSGLCESFEGLKLNPVYKHATNSEWTPVDYSEFEYDLDFLIESLKTIRNNLFHGSKQSLNRPININRDVWLFEACLLILDFLVSLDAEVQQHFEISELEGIQ